LYLVPVRLRSITNLAVPSVVEENIVEKHVLKYFLSIIQDHPEYSFTMADDQDDNQDLTAKIEEWGWTELTGVLGQAELGWDVLSVMIGAEASGSISHILDKVGFTSYSPKSMEGFKSVLSVETGGIMHFVQSGADTAVVPANSELYQRSDLISDPQAYGSILLILDKPIPLSAFKAVSRGIRKPTAWVQRGCQLIPAQPLVDANQMEVDGEMEWNLADKKALDYSPIPEMVAIEAVMISVIPSFDEKDVTYGMSGNSRIAYYLETKDRPGLGTNDLFLGIQSPTGDKTKVVSCSSYELYSLLTTTGVPALVKFYSTYANVFRFTAKAICKYAEVYTFKEAQELWNIPNAESVTAVNYQIAVSTYILGPCYTIKENVPRQIAKRLSACRASLGEEAVTEAMTIQFIHDSAFDPGLPNSIAAEIIGIAVAIITGTKSDCNSLRRDLLPVPAIISQYGLDKFTAALYTQLRLVAEGLQSTTIRFALAGLVPLAYVWNCAPPYLKAEANDLRKMKDDLENRPYTGCTDPIPAQFTIASCPYLCYFGVEAFRKSLTEEQKKKFQKYNVTGIIEKLEPKKKSMIDSIITITPEDQVIVLAEYLQKLPLNLAETQLSMVSANQQGPIRELILTSDADSAMKTDMIEKERVKHLEKVNNLLIARITARQTLKVGQISQQLEDARDAQEQNRLKDTRNEIRDKYDALIAKCTKTDDDWIASIDVLSLNMHRGHYDAITAALNRVEQGGSVEVNDP